MVFFSLDLSPACLDILFLGVVQYVAQDVRF